MPSVLDVLSDVRKKLREGRYKNEEQVRLSIVARVLQALGWDIWDPREVYPEFATVPEEGRAKVDLALFSRRRTPSVFIEVKAVGQMNVENTERQLRDYNRNHTVTFCVMTDGRFWRLYYAPTAGPFAEKCFETVDIDRDDLGSVAASLADFLSKTAIGSGTAEQKAKQRLLRRQHRREMERCVEEAEGMVQRDPFPSLPQALLQLVAEEYPDIGQKEITEFLATDRPPMKPTKIGGPTPPPGDAEVSITPGHKELSPHKWYSLAQLARFSRGDLKGQLVSRKPTGLRVPSREIPLASSADLSEKFVKWLQENGHLPSHQLPIPDYAGKSKYFVNLKREHSGAQKGTWRAVGDMFVDTGYNADRHVRNILAALHYLGLGQLKDQIYIKWGRLATPRLR
jgi:type I restriction and modification enzyme subunit R-like protein